MTPIQALGVAAAALALCLEPDAWRTVSLRTHVFLAEAHDHAGEAAQRAARAFAHQPASFLGGRMRAAWSEWPR